MESDVESLKKSQLFLLDSTTFWRENMWEVGPNKYWTRGVTVHGTLSRTSKSPPHPSVLSNMLSTLTLILKDAEHIGGVACRCNECQRLKDQEDKWICRLGTFHPPHGLNTRDEIKTRSRVNFSRLTQAGS